MNNLQIVIIDDDKISSMEAVRVIKESGITNNVKTALNGGHALLLLSQIYIEISSRNLVILLDLKMPIMDGFDFLKEFGKKEFMFRQDARIAVLVSDDTDQHDIEIARSMGITEFIRKPFNKKELTRVLGSDQKLEKVA